jgi:hypothetical protein
LFLLSVVNRGFKPWSHQTKDNKIKFHYFSAKNAALKSNNKDLLAQNQECDIYQSKQAGEILGYVGLIFLYIYQI